MELCIYDDILDAIWIADKKLLHFKLSNSGQIIRVDKSCFPRPGHILCVKEGHVLVIRYEGPKGRYRIAENIGGRKFWRIWRIGRESPKFSCPKFSTKNFPAEN